MNCNHCGAPLNGDETVCPACGQTVETPEPAPVQPETESQEPETAEAPAEETAEEETLLCPEPEAPALPDAEAVDSPVEEQPAALTANMTAIARAIAFLFITKTS